jgi:A118 family predicted phage portal protein
MLPTQNIKFPLEDPIYTDYAEHSAWYSGDSNQLALFYGSLLSPPSYIAGDFFSENYYNSVAPRQKFWQKQVYEERRTILHVPVAGDIASMSANMLFAESPKFNVSNEQTQDRLNDIIQRANVNDVLLQAAEIASAMGGVYLKINWDTDFVNYPILSIVQPENAIPVFQWGILKEVTFYKTIRVEEGKKEHTVYRLLENHTVGRIEYGLYKGTDDYLGMRVGLGAIPETSGLQDEIMTNLDDLLVRYIPNVKPNRKHRGSPYGQSDLSGLEGLMDALDETYSSWMRDVRLGKGRLLVPESFLQKLPNGDFAYDIDKEVFTPLEMDPLSAGNTGITNVQFNIRTQEHMDTCLELLNRIISSAGYSPQSFGLSIKGSVESGTALNIRERRSFVTQSKKRAYWKSPIEDLMYLMLQIDQLNFNSRITPEKPTVEFGDSLIPDLGQMASAVETLARAQAISIESKVRLSRPELTDEQVMIEVQKIKEELGIGTEDSPEDMVEDVEENNNNA